MGCASGIVKYLVFLFNLVFALAGLAMLAVGILYQLELNDITNAIDDRTYALAPTFVIVVGTIVFVISFFGCCGAIRESTCMLTTYGVILLAIFILQIALGVFAFLQVKESDGSFKKEIYKAMDKAYAKYGRDKTTTDAIDSMQQVLKCCGNNGPGDFTQLPSSCCEGKPQSCHQADRSFFDDACNKKLYRSLKDNVEILGYVAIGLCATELIAAIFSFCLSSSIRNERRRGHYA